MSDTKCFRSSFHGFDARIDARSKSWKSSFSSSDLLLTSFDTSFSNDKLLRGAYNCLHPPFRKGGKGGFETWKIPLNPPLLKGDFPNLDFVDKSSQKQASRCPNYWARLSRIRMLEKKPMRSIHTNNKM